ncbi:MAG: hypothetical protein ILP16_09800 [Spirochaetales bacterium]|nr:hypothetical protein [Spirochaetales bacterium]
MSRKKESASDVLARTKADTILALSEVIRLQEAIIDHLYLVISSVDTELVDEHTLRQIKRAAEITDDYT